MVESYYSPTCFTNRSDYSSDKRDMGMGSGWGFNDLINKFKRAPPRNVQGEQVEFLEKDYDEFV